MYNVNRMFLGILSTGHYMLYYLTPAIQPRMLVTFDEALQPVSVSVRVGQVSRLYLRNHVVCINVHVGCGCSRSSR